MSRAFIKRISLTLLTTGLLLCGQAFALTLGEAKQQGLVGETLSGYLAPVKQDAQSIEFATRINDARKQQYQQVAQDNQVTTDDVAKLAGQKLVARAGKGEWVRGLTGSGCRSDRLTGQKNIKKARFSARKRVFTTTSERVSDTDFKESRPRADCENQAAASSLIAASIAAFASVCALVATSGPYAMPSA
jgi:uncharacterized protein